MTLDFEESKLIRRCKSTTSTSQRSNIPFTVYWILIPVHYIETGLRNSRWSLSGWI